MKDFNRPDNVHVQVNGDKLWVNIDGKCELRSYGTVPELATSMSDYDEDVQDTLKVVRPALNKLILEINRFAETEAMGSTCRNWSQTLEDLKDLL